jgi:hypothetical protein
MQLAGRLCGQCCRCWRELTDPVSIERGIGPDCYQGIIDRTKEYAGRGMRRESIAFYVGMPVEFINTILCEQQG